MAMESNAEENYENLMAVLETDAPLAARQAAAVRLAQLIGDDILPPDDLRPRLNTLYAAAADVRLATDLLKAKNSLVLREKDVRRPRRPGGMGNSGDGNPHLAAALDRLRRLHDAGKPGNKSLDDRYHVESMICEGGMGKIFRGLRRSDQRPVAVKFLSDMFIHSDNARRRFEREYRLLASLDHPNIITVLDYGADDRQCYIVMDYIAGGDLAARIRRADLHPARLLPLFIDVCSGLAAVHEKGIVHRDIKPSNILLHETGDAGETVIPKLTDFGLARDAADNGLTSAGSRMGTMTFSPPEQIADPRTVGPTGDIYALGVAMYYAFSGGNTPSGNYPELEKFNPSTPPAINRIIDRCLQRRPADRWPSATHLAEAIRLAVDHTELLASD